jgi:hypothetical protein
MAHLIYEALREAVRFGAPALRVQLISSQSRRSVKPEEFTLAALATMLSIMIGDIKWGA